MLNLRLIISEPWDFSFTDGLNITSVLLCELPLFTDLNIPYFKVMLAQKNIFKKSDHSFLIVAPRHKDADLLKSLKSPNIQVLVNIAVPKGAEVKDIQDCGFKFIGELKR